MFSTIVSLSALVLVLNHGPASAQLINPEPTANLTLPKQSKLSPMPWDRYVVNFQQATFFEAWQFCQAAGLRLATVNSPADTDLLEKALAAAKAPQKGAFFIAGTNLGAKGSWLWISTNRKVGTPYGYTRWHPGQPDNSGNNEHCMEIWYVNGAFWNDYQCDKKRGYILLALNGTAVQWYHRDSTAVHQYH
ncbi:hypothetical protein quinque_006698 [Culex quinquefasciatus]